MAIDREPEYLKIAEHRIKSFQSEILKIRPLGRPVLVPNKRAKVAQVPKEWLANSAEKLLRK